MIPIFPRILPRVGKLFGTHTHMELWNNPIELKSIKIQENLQDIFKKFQRRNACYYFSKAPVNISSKMYRTE